jgi:hypothetical protein
MFFNCGRDFALRADGALDLTGEDDFQVVDGVYGKGVRHRYGEHVVGFPDGDNVIELSDVGSDQVEHIGIDRYLGQVDLFHALLNAQGIDDILLGGVSQAHEGSPEEFAGLALFFNTLLELGGSYYAVPDQYFPEISGSDSHGSGHSFSEQQNARAH